MPSCKPAAACAGSKTARTSTRDTAIDTSKPSSSGASSGASPGPASRTASFTAADLADPRILLATGFGIGLFPKAPGTMGSLLALCLWWLLLLDLALAAQAAIVAAAFALGTWAIRSLAQSRDVGDAAAIVIDEIVGCWLALAIMQGAWAWIASIWSGGPWGEGAWWLLVAFALFRLFDIVKPWPVGWLDRTLKNHWGIMLDDVLAGLLAAVDVLVLRALAALL